MIAQQLGYDVRSGQKALSKALELGASVTHIDVAVAWMVALAAVGSITLLFWQI
jgi:hypothetical protein